MSFTARRLRGQRLSNRQLNHPLPLRIIRPCPRLIVHNASRFNIIPRGSRLQILAEYTIAHKGPAARRRNSRGRVTHQVVREGARLYEPGSQYPLWRAHCVVQPVSTYTERVLVARSALKY